MSEAELDRSPVRPSDATNGPHAGDKRVSVKVDSGVDRPFGPGWLVLPAAFVAGAAVMLYELVAVRILQRDFGGTMDVWASEIAICLAALALGYSVGGRIADRAPSLRSIGVCLLVAGLLGFAIEPLARWAGNALIDSSFPMSIQPLVAAGVCTFVPILLLGTVLPQAIRLRTGYLERVGRSVGDVATVSTLGSIAGVIAPALYLFHIWGVREVLWLGAGVTALCGAAIALIPLRRMAIVAVTLILAVPASAQTRVHLDTYSAYHHIRVVDEGGVRALLFDDFPQSLMNIRNPTTGGFEYTDFFHVPVIFTPAWDRVLFIGLGGGTGPKAFLAYSGIRSDVAEIDPAVVQAARQYFAIPDDPRLTIRVADGRAMLRRAPRETYGAVIVDAYGSSPSGPYLPYHLATQEFFQIAWDRLRDGGSVVFNAVGVQGNDPSDTLRHVLVTMEAVFQHVYVFQARSSVNTVFVAVKVKPESAQGPPRAGGDAAGEAEWPYQPFLEHPVTTNEMSEMAAYLRSLGVPFPPGLERRVSQVSPLQHSARTGTVLTDNYAPTDLR